MRGSDFFMSCARCGRTLALDAEANYVRCEGCGAINVVDSVPPWSLAEAGAGRWSVATPAPPSARSSQPPPPPRRPPDPAARGASDLTPPPSTSAFPPTVRSRVPSAPPRAVAPTDSYTEELISIRCASCGAFFDGPTTLLHCPRCGAHHAVDAAPPWAVENLDDLP